jgi:hypothetical protein
MQVRTGHLRWVIADNSGLPAPGDSRQGNQAVLRLVARACRAVALRPTSASITMYDCQGRAAAMQAAAGAG